jgi:hypothetical protein
MRARHLHSRKPAPEGRLMRRQAPLSQAGYDFGISPFAAVLRAVKRRRGAALQGGRRNVACVSVVPYAGRSSRYARQSGPSTPAAPLLLSTRCNAVNMLLRSTTASINFVVPGPVISSPAVMLDTPIGLTREFRPLLPPGASGFSAFLSCVSFTIEAKIPFQD